MNNQKQQRVTKILLSDLNKDIRIAERESKRADRKLARAERKLGKVQVRYANKLQNIALAKANS